MGTEEAVKICPAGTADEMKLALARALDEIFSTMFNAGALLIPPESVTEPARVSAVVGFTGRMSGWLCLHFSSAMACNVASGLLGMPVAQVDETVRDAVGELSNMLAGGLKKQISRTDNMFKIAIPSVIGGTEYSLYTPPNAHQVWIGVAAGGSRFKVQLVLEPN
jgi:chemotaxis protein CheX